MAAKEAAPETLDEVFAKLQRPKAEGGIALTKGVSQNGAAPCSGPADKPRCHAQEREIVRPKHDPQEMDKLGQSLSTKEGMGYLMDYMKDMQDPKTRAVSPRPGSCWGCAG